MSGPFPPSGAGAALATQSGLNPFLLPSRWDQITINGTTWQGKIEIRAAKRHYKWQDKDTRGTESFSHTYQGLRPAPFTVVFYLYTSDQFASWPLFSSMFLYYGAKQQAQPFQISHPALTLVGITGVRVNSIVAPHQISDDHMFTAEVEMQQWDPEPAEGSAAANVTSTPTAKVTPKASLVPGFQANPTIAQKLARKQAALNNTGGTSAK